MPLVFGSPVQTPLDILSALPKTSTHYLILVASHEERGRPWCRDCEAAEPLIAANIAEKESTVVWVGSREEWNDPENNWKKAPFNVERIPTIIKLPAGEAESIEAKVEKAPRIQEAQILEGSVFKSFLKK